MVILRVLDYPRQQESDQMGGTSPLGLRPFPSPIRRGESLARSACGDLLFGVAEMKGRKWIAPPSLWPDLKPKARAMRHEPTSAEAILWERLRNRRLGGYRFRRQHSVGRFIVDFLCLDAQLVVEVDGPIHRVNAQRDRERKQKLESAGLHVLRFTNDEITHHLDRVMKEIDRHLTAR